MKGRPARKGKQAGAMAAVCALVTLGRKRREARDLVAKTGFLAREQGQSNATIELHVH